ncbi:DNA primase [Variovorax sp. OV329]|uniref:DNA primase n=1 Tax=Variovorax sp. OV329 TaxID=1882825 RepID=UPI0008E2E9D7|nr:DNA primase [Variovorax sp. OV329]SFM53427.1 DNA primase [Variovorax sp. OV329]
MTIPASFIQELIARADIVEIVGRSVQLRKGGANFMGLCPFHSEKSPSFTVSPTKQFYHCFGCGAHGNAIGFLMEHGGMGFVEAVQDLAGQYGLQVPEDDASPQDRARAASQRQKQASLSDVLEKAGESYRAQLKRSDRAVNYFKGRGLSGEIAKRFGLGYAPEGWRSLASVFPDYEEPLLVESGLVITSDEGEGKRYDRFRDRVMFPIRNVKGECIGFGGRVLGDDKPKYLNSPETPVFSKGRELYGLFEARTALREKGYALVTEGYMDVVALAQLGFPNAVATLGTACTNEHVQKLFRFTDSVVFSFDGDAAGRRAARKALDAALPFASDVRTIKFLFLPAEHDPDSFIREFGADAFARFVGEATPLSRFMLEAAREGCDLGTAEGRAHLSSNIGPMWTALPEGALKRQLLGEIAGLVQLGAQDLSDLWKPAAAPARRNAPAGGQESPPAWDGPPDAPWEGSGGYDPDPGYGSGDGYGSGGGYGSGSGHGSGSAYGSGERRGGFKGRRQQFNRPPRPQGRIKPTSRQEVAARLLLSNMAPWEGLSHELHTVLCELPGELGELFRWIDTQHHEHGTLPWAALREGLRGLSFEPMALKLMTGPDGAPVGDMEEEASSSQAAPDVTTELKDVLARMLIDRLGAQLTETAGAFGTDPAAPERYRALEARRRELQASL